MPITLKQKVVSHLVTKGRVTARDIAHELNVKKTEVNSLLYTLLNAGEAHVNAKLEWTLTNATAIAKAALARAAPERAAPARSVPGAAKAAGGVSKADTPHPAKPAMNTTPSNPQPPVLPAWTDEQNLIIKAGPGERILVDAGPGTGKTATACARIAWLISSAGVEPTEIWLVSFTRTAVHELRKRIGSYLGNAGAVAGLKIATIDTHAWAIHAGFDEGAKLSGTFDDNIQRVIELVRNHQGVFEYLNSVRHLVVDEAQDVVGVRCELLLEIIHALPPATGVSVFSDEAQAIYGFAEDATAGAIEGTLPEKIREFMPNFRPLELTEIHRTSDKALVSVFGAGRKLVRADKTTGASRHKAVRDLVAATNHGDVGLYRDDISKLPEDLTDAFLLFRRRGEVLDASGYFGLRPHRLRMSGLPLVLHDWIATIFWDWTEQRMQFPEFETRWRQRCGPSTDAASKAWALLVSGFGESENRISVSRMVTRLASGSPPYELTAPEFGTEGPIIGTIHGAKGREASEVRLYVPPPPSTKKGQDDALTPEAEKSRDRALTEEARILFVGATRAKSRLRVGQAAPKAVPRRLDSSGRAYTPYPYYQGALSARAAVEIGRAADLDASGLVGRSFFSAKEAFAAQESVMKLRGQMANASATGSNPALEWRYRLLGDLGNALGYLTPDLNNDFFTIAKAVDGLVELGKLRPPLGFKHLRTFGFRTMAVAPDDPLRERLHSPWRDSGVIAVPMIIGYPIAYFR